jgi:prevent-host-death family protein
MSRAVTVHEAKTHLSRLLVEAEAGATIVITRAGTPVARLVGLEPGPRRPGRLKGKVRIARDFEAPLPEAVTRAFAGESD